MEIIFVRHGETLGNVAKRHQSDATPLTERGHIQIMETARYLKGLHPTHVLSSSVLRAVESARLIGEVLDMIPETNPIFAELERPKFLHGNFHKSIGSLWFYARWYFGVTNTAKEGGETYAALRARVGKAQEILSEYPENARIVVISHSVFINLFCAHACQKTPMNPFQAAMRFIRVLTIKNGSMTKFIFDSSASARTCRWQLAPLK